VAVCSSAAATFAAESGAAAAAEYFSRPPSPPRHAADVDAAREQQHIVDFGINRWVHTKSSKAKQWRMYWINRNFGNTVECCYVFKQHGFIDHGELGYWTDPNNNHFKYSRLKYICS
jgi:hypothetical protein